MVTTTSAGNPSVLTLDMSVEQALALIANGRVPMEAYLEWDSARIARLTRTTSGAQPMRFKVSEKGAVSVYGLQRMPVTLYVGQWERLLGETDKLKAFMVENNAKLSRKQ